MIKNKREKYNSPLLDNCTTDNCPSNNSHLRQLPTRQLTSGQFPPRTIAAPDNYPLDNSHLGKLSPDNCTWTISSWDSWPSGLTIPGHLPLRTIPIRVILPKRLGLLEIFYSLSFRLYIKITLKTNWNMQHLLQ